VARARRWRCCSAAWPGWSTLAKSGAGVRALSRIAPSGRADSRDPLAPSGLQLAPRNDGSAAYPSLGRPLPSADCHVAELQFQGALGNRRRLCRYTNTSLWRPVRPPVTLALSTAGNSNERAHYREETNMQPVKWSTAFFGVVLAI